MKTVPVPSDEEVSVRRVELPPSDKKLLIFDMDETLMHCVDDIEEEAPQIVLDINLEGVNVPAGVNIRPYVKECLLKAKELFQVIIFTASYQEYADPILNEIDPEGTLFEKRLYRDSCHVT